VARPALAVNSELVRLYWDIGRMIDARQRLEGWGAGVIPRLATELKNEMPELKGFSERNIKRMLAFYRDYRDPAAIVQQPAAKLVSQGKVPPVAAQFDRSLLWALPWFHHVVLMEKVKDLAARRWYMTGAVEPMTRWCRPRGAASRISPRGAWPAAPQRRWN
jgi:hypothetical protein